MQDYERLGVFYLGCQYDPERRTRQVERVLYDSRDLATHGLVVGMTGSGKTGLCVALIEEAALDGVPAIVIDPKGDLTNLRLTFPDLRPEDFAPWINPDDARRHGMTEADYAADQAEVWRRGLAEWDQDGARIRRLREAAEFVIYTPGSSMGRPLALLDSFRPPPPELLEEVELLQDRIAATVASLLGLAGVEVDPVRSREATLLGHLLQQAWRAGEALDLPALIHQVQQPPVQRLGVLELETFYPAKERFGLAMQLNRLLASPGLAAWAQGEPLDVGRLLFGASGKPRVAILSIAHLGDRERMFFVTALLNQVLGWMRGQPGTDSLRALLYMDEIAGFFPPVANPPSKRPLLALLKQARAFGVGLVLATQNPVDLDYRGLANIGTWFIGRLQTERDQARLLEGLEGATAGQGRPFDRASAGRILAGLGKRVFLLHNVHEDEPIIFESRWAMSYLRGPLTRGQLRGLASEDRVDSPPVPSPSREAMASGNSPSAPPLARTGGQASRPMLPPQIRQFFVPVRLEPPPGATLCYWPRLIGAAAVRYTDPKLGVDVVRKVVALTEIADRVIPVDWSQAEDASFELAQLVETAPPAEFGPLSRAATQAGNYADWAKRFAAWIHGERRLRLFRSRTLKEISRLGEDERAFRIRLQQVARERRDATTEKLRRSYAPRLAALERRLRQAEAAREREAAQASRAQLDTFVSLGSTLLGAMFGRRTVSTRTLGRAAGTVRRAGRAFDQSADVARAGEKVGAIEQQWRELNAAFESDANVLVAEFAQAAAEIEPFDIPAARTGIQVELMALAWLPFHAEPNGALTPAS